MENDLKEKQEKQFERCLGMARDIHATGTAQNEAIQRAVAFMLTCKFLFGDTMTWRQLHERLCAAFATNDDECKLIGQYIIFKLLDRNPFGTMNMDELIYPPKQDDL